MIDSDIKADPDSAVKNTARKAQLNINEKRKLVFSGREARAIARTQILINVKILNTRKYVTKAAEFEAKRDAAFAQGNNNMADVYQAKIDNLQKKIKKPISKWGENVILIKEFAKDKFKKRGYMEYDPWEIRRAKALQDKVDGGKTL